MTPAECKEGFLKAANVVAYLLLFEAHIYENNKKPYFNPATPAFYIWPVIHTLLLSAIIYSFTSDRGKAVVIDTVSWRFPLLIILNAILVILWADHRPIVAFVVSYFFGLVGGSIFDALSAECIPKSLGEKLVAPFLPFSGVKCGPQFSLHPVGLSPCHFFTLGFCSDRISSVLFTGLVLPPF
jgi:hypothetical protein